MLCILLNSVFWASPLLSPMYFTGSFNLLKSPQLLIYKGILLKPLSYKRHEPQAPTSASEVSGDVFGGGEGMGVCFFLSLALLFCLHPSSHLLGTRSLLHFPSLFSPAYVTSTRWYVSKVSSKIWGQEKNGLCWTTKKKWESNLKLRRESSSKSLSVILIVGKFSLAISPCAQPPNLSLHLFHFPSLISSSCEPQSPRSQFSLPFAPGNSVLLLLCSKLQTDPQLFC